MKQIFKKSPYYSYTFPASLYQQNKQYPSIQMKTTPTTPISQMETLFSLPMKKIIITF